MVHQAFSSGDLTADRRAEFAETLAQAGDAPAAADAMRAALDLAPNWAAGWYRLGEFCQEAQLPEAALAAWKTCLDLDPTDRFGASLKCDLLQPRAPISERLPSAFVETLFDQYAPRFERALIGKLAYRGPDLIWQALRKAGFQSADHALDLGCGTGLMGAVIRPYVTHLTGIDLSAAMLHQAAAKGIYDQLDRGDITQLPLIAARYDLIVAADVFNYLGALEQIIGFCTHALRPGGILAFTLETGQDPLRLMPSRRFTHSQDYITGLLRDAGFGQMAITSAILRQDRGQPVAGMTVTAAQGARRQSFEDDGETGALV